ncbi:MAG: glycosyltransferase family 4 protein [Rhizobiaceae bacterium]
MTSNNKVAIFLKGYPRLSETFIAQEILGLQKAGLDLELVSLRHPTDSKRHPVHEEITAPVRYLPEYIHDEPKRCLRAWLKVRHLPGYRKARSVWLKDLFRDRTRNRVRRFVQSLVAAAELGDDIAWLYGHFIHTPGSVTRYTAIMRDLPYSISAHAKDIWTSPDWELSEKLDDAQWTVTCTKGGADHLASLAYKEDAVKLLYHGLDLRRFPVPPEEQGADSSGRPARAFRNGADVSDPVQFLSVGRAVEKKGFDTLLDALSLLPANLNWRWTHIAGGPLLGKMKQQAQELGLTDRLEFLGSQAQSRVLQAYRECDVFVLPCRIAPDGDRDGLPNVIVEAQSQSLPVISTPISGIPELITDGRNGLLVEPNDPQKLAAALVELARDPKRRQQMGKAGMKIVRSDFDAANEIKQLIRLMRPNSTQDPLHGG